MAEGREEKNWDKANDAYTAVQNALVSNKVFELYCDGDRMLPPSIKPEVDKIQVVALPLKVETMTMAGELRLVKKNSAEEKKQKARDIKLNVPNDAFLGFRTAGQLAAGALNQNQISPNHEFRDRKVAALLTTEEEAELRERWRFAGNKSVKTTSFDTQFLPFERGFTGAANCIPSHSTRFSDALAILRNCEVLDDSQSENLDKWTDKLSNAYDPSKIRLWDRSGRSEDYRPHQRIRSSFPELAPMSTFPIPTAPQSGPLLIPTSPASTLPEPSTFKRILPPDLTLPQVSQPIKLKPLGKAPPIVKAPPIARVLYRPQLQEEFTPVLTLTPTPRDQFGILSSEPDELPLARPTLASTYPFDAEGYDDFPMSDDVLMKGSTAKGIEVKMVQVVEEIVVVSDEEDDGMIPAGPVRKASLPQISKPTLAKLMPSVTIPDSDDEIEEFDLPRPSSPSKEVVATSRPQIPPRNFSPPPRLPSATESEDEYSYFDLPDEEELNALENAAIRGQPILTYQHESIEAGTEDAIMPPPLPSAKAKAETYRKRPQHHQVPDSDSSVAAGESAKRIRTSQDALEPSFEDSPILAKRAGTLKKKIVLADSSSPEHSIAGPSKLNRLRRGVKDAEISEDDDAIQVDSAPRKKKTKRVKMDAKMAARSKLFDVEAVNSSASGSEASSEEYSAEGSQDRNFAGEDWELEDDPSDQAQFYRDSLATQHNSKFKPAYRRDAFTRRAQGEVPVYRGSPTTPHSVDTYR